MEKERPKVGVGIIIEREGKILLGERLGGHGAGNWSIPGGHLELGETFEETALHEAAEETGIADLEIVGLVAIINNREYEKHYVTLGMLARWKSGEPTTPEPEKSGNWHWHDPKDLPENMFAPSRKCVENWLAGTLYSD